MTCTRAINLARRHAALCDEIERTAPAVHATKLREALERMRKRVHVEYREGLGYRVQHRNPFYLSKWLDAEEAQNLYFALANTFAEPAPASSLSSGGAQPAGASASASLFESAAPTSGASSLADKTGAETPSASVANSGAAS